MFGYACDETPEYMPLPIALAHQLTKRLADVRKDRTLPYLRPDGKSQVTVEYANDRPQRVDTVVIAAQHAEAVSTSQLRKEITELVIRPVLGDLYSDQIRLHINATGRFVLGGPPADTGLTGRKIIVDTYGGVGAHGGGAFSGKDVSKVDRSASYAARYIAKNLVAAGIARRVEIQLAYAIGVAEPVSIMVNTFGTGTLENGDVIRLVQEHFPLKPADIISVLNLKRPIYEQTAAYGHFGRVDVSLPWEQLDRVDALKR
jgi:S-adenosylmethionine synthetase